MRSQFNTAHADFSRLQMPQSRTANARLHAGRQRCTGPIVLPVTLRAASPAVPRHKILEKQSANISPVSRRPATCYLAN